MNNMTLYYVMLFINVGAQALINMPIKFINVLMNSNPWIPILNFNEFSLLNFRKTGDCGRTGRRMLTSKTLKTISIINTPNLYLCIIFLTMLINCYMICMLIAVTVRYLVYKHKSMYIVDFLPQPKYSKDHILEPKDSLTITRLHVALSFCNVFKLIMMNKMSLGFRPCFIFRLLSKNVFPNVRFLTS